MDESPSDAPAPEMSAETAGQPQPEGVPATPVEGAREDAAREADHASMRLALAGDERGFAELVQRYERRAWRVARNLVPSDEDAQDLVQDAFMRVFRNLERFDFSHAFSTWLYRIVTNLAIDLLRKRRPTYSTTGSEEDEADPEIVDERVEDPSAALLREETVGEVQACLDSLAPHFQSALVLRELEGLPCNEIAEIVGATHVTVRWRLHRGRKLFQEEWERRERDQESRASANALPSFDVDPASVGQGEEARPGAGARQGQAPSTALGGSSREVADEGGAPRPNSPGDRSLGSRGDGNEAR